MLYRAARGDVVRRCEPSKNRFFLITQPAEPQVGCCLATLLVLLASLLVLLALFVLLASLLSLACCLAALWRQLCNAIDKIPTQWHQQHGQAFCQQDFVHFWNMTVEREKNWFAFDIVLQIRANIKQNTGFLVTERWVTTVSMVCSFLRG